MLTKGFISADQCLLHFEDHSNDFGAKDASEYEQMADIFLGGPAPVGAFECDRPQGDLVRYDPKNNVLGILMIDGTIHTFFKPVFCWQATAEQRLRLKCHKQKSHLAYVKKQCKRTFPF